MEIRDLLLMVGGALAIVGGLLVIRYRVPIAKFNADASRAVGSKNVSKHSTASTYQFLGVGVVGIGIVLVFRGLLSF
jgi:hypothetical protein